MPFSFSNSQKQESSEPGFPCAVRWPLTTLLELRVLLRAMQTHPTKLWKKSIHMYSSAPRYMLSLICTSSPKGVHETGCNARSTLALVVHTKLFQNLEHWERHSCSCGASWPFCTIGTKPELVRPAGLS